MWCAAVRLRIAKLAPKSLSSCHYATTCSYSHLAVLIGPIWCSRLQTIPFTSYGPQSAAHLPSSAVRSSHPIFRGPHPIVRHPPPIVRRPIVRPPPTVRRPNIRRPPIVLTGGSQFWLFVVDRNCGIRRAYRPARNRLSGGTRGLIPILRALRRDVSPGG